MPDGLLQELVVDTLVEVVDVHLQAVLGALLVAAQDLLEPAPGGVRSPALDAGEGVAREHLPPDGAADVEDGLVDDAVPVVGQPADEPVLWIEDFLGLVVGGVELAGQEIAVEFLQEPGAVLVEGADLAPVSLAEAGDGVSLLQVIHGADAGEDIVYSFHLLVLFRVFVLATNSVDLLPLSFAKWQG